MEQIFDAGLKNRYYWKTKKLVFLSMITIKVLFLTEHSSNSSYLDQVSPQYCYRTLLSCSGSNSVKSVQGLGVHFLVTNTFKSPQSSQCGRQQLWALEKNELGSLLDALYIL